MNAALGVAEAERAAGNTAAAIAAANNAMSFSRTSASSTAVHKARQNIYNTTPATAPTVEPETGPGPGPGPSGPAAVVQSAGDRAQENYYNNLREEQKTSARAFLNTLLTQYNMQSLAGQIESLIQQSTNQDFLAEKVRETAEYKTRFKGLIDLQARGITDVRNEGEYLELETNYRRVFREAGLVNYLGVSGSQGEYNSIADLVGKFSLSVNEVQDRVLDAQRVVADTPQEVRDSLQRFYNVDPATLVEYALDPTRTQNKINQLANTAIVGGYASRAGLNLDVGGAESIASLSGSSDINVERFTVDAAAGRAVRDSTKRLAEIEKSTLSDTESLTASMGVDTEAKKKVTTLQSRERARFGGTSAIGSTTLSNARTI
jgi:hypothetical protein